MHPARREEQMVGRAAEEAPVDTGLLAPIPSLAMQVALVLLLALEPEVVVPFLLARIRGTRSRVPRLPVNLPVEVRSHAVRPSHAVDLCLPRHAQRPCVPSLHLREDLLRLRPRPRLGLPPFRTRGQARLALTIHVIGGILQPLHLRPGDVAGPPLGLLREGLVAADLLKLELALPAEARELRPDVGPPGPAEGVTPPCGHEVGGEFRTHLALPAHATLRLIAIGHNVKALVKFCENLREWAQDQEVCVQVETTVVEEHGRAHDVGLAGGVGQAEPLLRSVGNQAPEVGIVHAH
mmetsp:Transcript_74290/g.217859  ORF Transcript_74290/g.217859 Transcript_74290/m.217859 type:complete len:294 (+) Transcript_74290:117-998(+)